MNASIDLDALLASAIVRADGVRPLGRALDWSHVSIIHVQRGEKISAYRAAQLARYLELGRSAEAAAIITALAEQAKSGGEAAFWSEWLKGVQPVAWCDLSSSLVIEHDKAVA